MKSLEHEIFEEIEARIRGMERELFELRRAQIRIQDLEARLAQARKMQTKLFPDVVAERAAQRKAEAEKITATFK